jgi:hypothetical protein
VALDDLRPLLRRRRDLQRHRRLIIAMAALRKFLHLEKYLHPVHFENLGKLLLMMSLLWGYFVFNERLTVWYGNDDADMNVFWVTQRGSFAPLFWLMVTVQLRDSCDHPRHQEVPHHPGCVIASIGILRRHVARALPDCRAVAQS